MFSPIKSPLKDEKAPPKAKNLDQIKEYLLSCKDLVRSRHTIEVFLRKYLTLPLEEMDFKKFEKDFMEGKERGMFSISLLESRYIHIIGILDFYGLKEQADFARTVRDQIKSHIKTTTTEDTPLSNEEKAILDQIIAKVEAKPTSTNVKNLLTCCLTLNIPLFARDLVRLETCDVEKGILEKYGVKVDLGWVYRVIRLCIKFLYPSSNPYDSDDSCPLIIDKPNTFTTRVSRLFKGKGVKKFKRDTTNTRARKKQYFARAMQLSNVISVLHRATCYQDD